MSAPIVNWNIDRVNTIPFQVFPIGTTFKDDPMGNYIFARPVNGGWEAVYIGEGDINQRINDHISNRPVIAKGATHIHVYENNNEKNRFDLETKLLAIHTEAYVPTGCNIKKGG